MKIFHAEMFTAGKPVKNLNFVLLIVGSRAPGRFSKQRDLLEAFEGVAGRHHYPNAVICYQLVQRNGGQIGPAHLLGQNKLDEGIKVRAQQSSILGPGKERSELVKISCLKL